MANSSDNVSNFSANLRRLRFEAGISLRALADHVGYSYGRINSLEKGEGGAPGLDHALEIAQFFDTTLEQMLQPPPGIVFRCTGSGEQMA